MPGPAPALQTLRSSQDRVLEREGIPMVLALVSEVGEVPVATDDAVRGEGERLAASMDGFRDELIPGMREEDNGCLISVLVAVSYADFAGPPADLSESAIAQRRNEVGR